MEVGDGEAGDSDLLVLSPPACLEHITSSEGEIHQVCQNSDSLQAPWGLMGNCWSAAQECTILLMRPMGRKDQIASAQCCKPYGLQCEVMSTATELQRLAGAALCKSPAHPLHAFYLAQMTLLLYFATSLAPPSFGPHTQLTQHAGKGGASRQAGRKKPRAQMLEDCAAGRQIACAFSTGM
jgi:hypothetical protein